MWIPRCGGLLQSGFLISGTWIPEIPIVCKTPDSLGCIQRPKPRIPDYLTSDKIGQKASIFIIKLLFTIFSNEYMQGKPNSFKTGLKTTLKFNIRLGSSVLTYPDCPCKNGNMWPYD